MSEKNDSLSSFRAELSGIAGIIAATSKIIEYHKIKQGGIKIGLDNEAAIKQITSKLELKQTARSGDLVKDIRVKIKTSHKNRVFLDQRTCIRVIRIGDIQPISEPTL